MLPIESLWGFVTGLIAYGGGATAIAYFAFQFFGKSWMEAKFAENLEAFRHQQAVELQKLQSKAEALLNGTIKLQDRDFDILPEAWGKLHHAFQQLSAASQAFQSYPDLNKYNKDELREFLDQSDFPSKAKRQILESTKPLDEYIEILTWRRLADVQNAIVDLNTYVGQKGVFLPTELREKFEVIARALWSALVTKRVGHEAKDWKMQGESYTQLQTEITPKFKEIESVIHRRLRSHGELLD